MLTSILLCLLATTAVADDATQPFVPPAIIVTMPAPNDLTRVSVSLNPTGKVGPETVVVATARLGDGSVLKLRAWTIPGSINSDTFFYPLTDDSLPVKSLPAGSSVNVTLTTTDQRFLSQYPQATIVTVPMLLGSKQSADRATVTLFGRFDATSPLYVQFNNSFPLDPSALTVAADRVTIEAKKDKSLRTWASGTFPFTVAQRRADGAIACDTTMVSFTSLLGPQ